MSGDILTERVACGVLMARGCDPAFTYGQEGAYKVTCIHEEVVWLLEGSTEVCILTRGIFGYSERRRY